jgi:hypothetical protein
MPGPDLLHSIENPDRTKICSQGLCSKGCIGANTLPSLFHQILEPGEVKIRQFQFRDQRQPAQLNAELIERGCRHPNIFRW